MVFFPHSEVKMLEEYLDIGCARGGKSLGFFLGVATRMVVGRGRKDS